MHKLNNFDKLNKYSELVEWHGFHGLHDAWDDHRMRKDKPVDWISGAEAAVILGVSRTTVYNSLKDDDARERQWGKQGVGWRHKPLSTRGAFQVSRAVAERIAAES